MAQRVKPLMLDFTSGHDRRVVRLNPLSLGSTLSGVSAGQGLDGEEAEGHHGQVVRHSSTGCSAIMPSLEAQSLCREVECEMKLEK